MKKKCVSFIGVSCIELISLFGLYSSLFIVYFFVLKMYVTVLCGHLAYAKLFKIRRGEREKNHIGFGC